MAGLVAPGVVRYSVLGTYAGRPVANIIDIHIDAASQAPQDREDCVLDQAKILVSAWADNICPRLVDNYVAQSVKWVDLDTATGTVGETSDGTGTNFPKAGNASDAAMPGNVAYRVNRQITAQRGQRKGRMYLVGVRETATTDLAPNIVDPGEVTLMNAALDAFKDDVEQNASASIPSYDSWISVVHTKKGPIVDGKQTYVYVGRSHVDTLVLDPTLGSQRRRLRG